jgi:ketosteroid isomerase-like protein
MSRENVERIKAGFAAHNRGDVDALVEVYDPEAVFETLLLGTHHGNQAIRLIYEENQKTLSGYDVVPVELIDAGDKVVAVAQAVGSGPASQIAVDEQFAFVFTFKGRPGGAGAGLPKQGGSSRSGRLAGLARLLPRDDPIQAGVVRPRPEWGVEGLDRVGVEVPLAG